LDEDTRKRLTTTIQQRLRETYEACCGTLEQTGSQCLCPGENCPLHGRCAACIAWHRDHARQPLPHCLRGVPGVSFEIGKCLRNIKESAK